jgi:hypothetical protein
MDKLEKYKENYTKYEKLSNSTNVDGYEGWKFLWLRLFKFLFRWYKYIFGKAPSHPQVCDLSLNLAHCSTSRLA